ncbi:hypothetical protein EVAR_21331_1 [Eumeta japonica]|uniref:Uncharacterized protein n=1 Tax=Eumeta variegata TaxID=151549 RepID=A0A4C1ZTW5_EUMVA|nr:hypothetical protein EVAR_21331_1 [Eumeta japonica]
MTAEQLAADVGHRTRRWRLRVTCVSTVKTTSFCTSPLREPDLLSDRQTEERTDDAGLVLGFCWIAQKDLKGFPSTATAAAAVEVTGAGRTRLGATTAGYNPDDPAARPCPRPARRTYNLFPAARRRRPALYTGTSDKIERVFITPLA